MERNPLHAVGKEELIAIIEDLRLRLSGAERLNLELTKRLEEQARRIEELEKRNPTKRLDESYSMKAEEKRQAEAGQSGKTKRGKNKSARRGRIDTATKLALATLEEDIFPIGYRKEDCRWKYSRPVWRIIDGRAIRVAYHIYAGPDGRVPQIPGVAKRGEFGSEIIIALAYQHYTAGLPLDTVIGEFSFYWDLTLRKSQADAMLNRLAKEWLPEFDSLCQLISVSAVVYADETSWSINSVWAFLSEKARVTIFGCHKDGETLAVLLKKDEFRGILVSDDAAVYQGFDRAQKCRAHLIRKAIKLTLQKPNRPRYRQFLDALLDIYRRGKAIAADKRMCEAGRRKRVDSLVDAICACTGARFADESIPSDDVERDFYNLTHEIVRLLGDDELFTYVISPEADGTNNESERSLRPASQDRDTGQTTKTQRGSRRRTVTSSVFDSLRLYLPKLTLQAVQAEIERWRKDGISCFRHIVETLKLPKLNLPENISSPLDLLIPLNDSG